MKFAVLVAALFPMCGPVDSVKSGPSVGCPQWEHLLEEHNPGWDVKRMSRIMWRESNCLPWIRSKSRDTGLLQINDINYPWLSEQFGMQVESWHMVNPVSNVAAAAALYRFWVRENGNGYQPWRATDEK
jgi:hypothetical protein